MLGLVKEGRSWKITRLEDEVSGSRGEGMLGDLREERGQLHFFCESYG